MSRLKHKTLLPISGIYEAGISYQSAVDGSAYVLLLCSNGALIRYNINKDKLKKLTTISRQLSLSPAIGEHFTLDIDHNVLYFCDDFFAVYNLNTNEWDIKCKNTVYDTDTATKLNYYLLGSKKLMQFISNPVNELHLVSKGKHIKYDSDQNTFIELQDSNFPKWSPRHLIYLKEMKLLVLLLWNLNIYYCRITVNNQKHFEWKLSKLMLPFEFASENNHVSIMTAFDNFIILFMSTSYVVDIWFIDMIGHKSYRSDKKYCLRAGRRVTSVVKDNEDILHCIGCGFYHRINLTDILPTFQKNKLMVYGFVRDIEDDLYQQIPTSLTQLIMSFYPSNL